MTRKLPTWRWFIWNPKRLALGIVAVFLLATLLNKVNHHSPRRTVATAAPVENTTTTVSAPTLEPGVSGPGSTTSVAPVGVSAPDSSTTAPSTLPQAAVAAALHWTQLWSSHTVQPGWTAALVPLSTPALAAVLPTVSPDNVPSTAVTGPVTASSGDQGGGTVQVPTDAGVMILSVSSDGHGGFLVSDIAPLSKG